MFFLRDLHRHPAFRDGLRDAYPQVPGTIAWGLMTGVAMVNAGMSVTESVLMTLLVFAGSAQLASIPLIMAGAPALVILATAFCVNLRFLVFGLHLRPHFSHLPRARRIGHGYFNGDMNYVLFTRRFQAPGADDAERREQEAYFAGLCCVNWIGWMVPSLAGIALANVIPTAWGLGFAGTLCLIGVMLSLASTRLRIVAGLFAAAVAVVGYTLPLRLNIVVAIGAAVLLALAAERLPRSRVGVRP